MNTKKCSVTVLIVFSLFLQQALAHDSAPPAPPPAELIEPEFPAASEIVTPGRTSIMRLNPQTFVAQEGVERSKGSPDTFVGVVSINPALLAKPADAGVSVGGSVLGVGLPRDMARLQLDVAGELYELHFFDEQTDPKYGLRHVTMDVLNHETSFARLSVDDRNGLIYGAIYTPIRTLRIVPGQTAGQQEVYLSGADSLASRSSVLVEQSSPAARVLAWRHLELEFVTKIRPEQAKAGYETRTSYIRGGNLGHLHRLNAKEFVRAAAELAPITQFKGTETFKIAETIQTVGGGQRVRLQQLIGSIPVDAINEVVVDASGKILKLSTGLVAGDFRRIDPLLSRADAWGRVVTEWEALESSRFQAADSAPRGRLLYRPTTSLNDLELIYEFRFTSDSTQLEYLARVNAVTGAAEVVRLYWHDFAFRTCRDVHIPNLPPETPQGPAPTACPAPGSTQSNPVPLYSIPTATNYICPQPPPTSGTCGSSESRNVYDVLSGMRTQLPAAAATNPTSAPACCSQMSTIQVIQNHRIYGDGPRSTNAGIIILPTGTGASAEIVAP